MSHHNLHTCEKAAPGWQKPGPCKECEREGRGDEFFGSLPATAVPQKPHGLSIDVDPSGDIWLVRGDGSTLARVAPEHADTAEVIEVLRRLLDACAPGPGEVSFFVPGLPRPGGSKRAFINRKTGRAIVTEDCERSKDWRTAVAFAAAARLPGWLPGPLRVTFLFYLPRPRGHYGTGANAANLRRSAPNYPAVRPDLTKLIRSTEDALKGIAWGDDAQIVEQLASKVYVGIGERPGVQITITPANEGLDHDCGEAAG